MVFCRVIERVSRFLPKHRPRHSAALDGATRLSFTISKDRAKVASQSRLHVGNCLPYGLCSRGSGGGVEAYRIPFYHLCDFGTG
jgi:hypothetical protein